MCMDGPHSYFHLNNPKAQIVLDVLIVVPEKSVDCRLMCQNSLSELHVLMLPSPMESWAGCA